MTESQQDSAQVQATPDPEQKNAFFLSPYTKGVGIPQDYQDVEITLTEGSTDHLNSKL